MSTNSNQSCRKAYTVLLVLILAALLQPKGGTWAWLYNVRWLYVIIVSFILSQLLTPLVIKIAFYFKILDYPNERKIHAYPIPRLGGLAVFSAIIITTLRNCQFSTQLLGLVAGSSLIYLVGLIDDIHPLPAAPRLVAQVIACLIVIKSGVVLNTVPRLWFAASFLNILLTVFWFVGISNAINFLDGVDGLVPGMMALCTFLFFLIAWHTRQSYLAYVTVAASGACLGFLPYNWKPARIFLGDAGSMFLGFLIAGIAVMGTWSHKHPMIAISTPLLILGIPIFDMIYTTISRTRNGLIHNFREWLEFTGRDHFHHRLMYLGLTEKQTVILIWALNVCIGLGALVIRETDPRGSFILLVQSVIIFSIVVVLMLMGRIAGDKSGTKWRSL